MRGYGPERFMTPQDDNQNHTYKLAKILSYIGGTLIFFGVSYLLFNNWAALATLGRIALTLGAAIWALILGVSFAQTKQNEPTSAVFFFLGGLLLPLGIYVTLDALGLRHNYELEKIFVSGISCLTFLGLQLRYPRVVLLFFTVVFGSIFFVASTNYLNHVNGYPVRDLLDYQILGLGVAYVLMGYIGSLRANALTDLLYFFGDILILTSTFSLGGLFSDGGTDLFWGIMTPVVILLSFLLYVPLKNKAFLYLGGIALTVYIARVSVKFAYLFGNLGWPALLIGGGVVLILLAYILIRLEKNNP
jgi:hypothetical protein